MSLIAHRPRPVLRHALAALLLTVTMAACGGGGGDGGTGTPVTPVVPSPPTVSSVAVGAIGPLVVGATASASATARDAAGTTITGRAITWASTSTSVATVNGAGLVSAVAPGSTEITATIDGVVGRATLVVNAAPVASVSIAALPSTLAGATRQAVVTARDGAGTTLTGTTVTWASENSAVATVSSTGLVTGVAPGTANITATVGGVVGRTTIEIVDPRNIPFFENKPFAAEYPSSNFLDHDIPKQFVDNNGIFTTFWGEVHANTGGMTDGHSGYDWSTPVGTPLFAMGPGRVVRVDESSQSFFCPPLNRNVADQKSVFIEHDLPGGVKIWAWYTHNSENRVTVGQVVTAGQTVALSGNTGCSSAPHLHFEVYRVVSTVPQVLRTIDPYGWTGPGVDPWSVHPDGSASIQLWRPGAAPQLSRQAVNNFTNFPASAAAVIGRVVYQGADDARNPNNEFIEIALDTRVAATASLDGYRIRADKALFSFAVPAGITLDASRPLVRFYSGTGTNTATAIYMGRTSGIWSNLPDDCARFVSPGGGQYRWNLGNGCPLPGPTFTP